MFRRGLEGFNSSNLTVRQLHDQIRVASAEDRQMMVRLAAAGRLQAPATTDQTEKTFILCNQIKSYLWEFAKYCPNMWAVSWARQGIDKGHYRDLFGLKLMSLRVLANAKAWNTQQGLIARSMLRGLLRFVD